MRPRSQPRPAVRRLPALGRPNRAPFVRPRIEILEDRQLLAVFAVTTTSDAGPGSLRQAILDANASPGTNTIAFAIDGTGVQTIQPATPLPAITNPMILDGTTQPGFDGFPLIELNGTGAGTGATGLTIDANASTVRGLVIDAFGGYGILLNGDSNHVAGNFIGTDATGAKAAGNSAGVAIPEGTDNVIGGTAAGDGNVISGNSAEGVLIQGHSNQVVGNFIGADASGSAALPNGGGISMLGDQLASRHGEGNTIASNVIAGNRGAGIQIGSHSARYNGIYGNLIGTDASGTVALPNADGIVIEGASGTVVGGLNAGSGNVIAGNRGDGLIIRFELSGTVVQGNFIGTDATGTSALPNRTGLYVYQADNNTIGGAAAGAGNVIAGNTAEGLVLDSGASFNQIQGNFIGTDATGAASLGNNQGVWITRGAQNNHIGGTAAGAGNVIAGNAAEGVAIVSGSTTVLEGNFIGTDATGTLNLGNAGAGVAITGAQAMNNTVGGTAARAGNTVAFNGGTGVRVDAGPRNAIRGNAMHDDVAQGIELDRGGNRDQAAPELTAATSDNGQTNVQGTLTAAPTTAFSLEFFANTVCHSSGFGEGERFLGRCTVTTDDTGTADFSLTFDQAVPADQFLTATATDPAGNTSQFSGCMTVTTPGAPGGRRRESNGEKAALRAVFVAEGQRSQIPLPSPALFPPYNLEADAHLVTRSGWDVVAGVQPVASGLHSASIRPGLPAPRRTDGASWEMLVDWGDL